MHITETQFIIPQSDYTLMQEVSLHELKSPTLVVIGQVVALSPGWHLAVATGNSLQDGRSYDPLLMSDLLKSKEPAMWQQ